MKHILINLLVVLACFSSCKEGATDNRTSTGLIDPENPAQLVFKDSIYDFGTISQGEIVKYTFYFTNKGKSDLVLENVKPSCGCTIPEWPKHPIKPGEGGAIDVSFNSDGKSGTLVKSITVTSNSKPSKHLLRLKGTVNAPN